MADIVFNKYMQLAISRYLAGKTLQITLVMTNSQLETAQETCRDHTNVSDITPLDECNSTGYSGGYSGTDRKTVTLTGEVDNALNRGSFQSTVGTYTWSTLNADASRSIAGVLFLEKGATADTDAFPIVYYQFAAPRQADGNDFVVSFDAGSGKFVRLQQGV